MRLRKMSMLCSIHKSSAVLAILIAGVAMGCSHSKKGQFADVTDREKGLPTTSAPVVVDQPQPQPAPPARPSTTTTPTQTDIAATRTAMTPSAGLTTAPVSEATTAPAGAAVSGGHQIIYDIGEHGVLLRRWEQSATVRAGGDVKAGATYWPTIDQAYRRPDVYNVFIEPAEFLLNTVLLPVRAVLTLPTEPVIYHDTVTTTERETRKRPPVTYKPEKRRAWWHWFMF